MPRRSTAPQYETPLRTPPMACLTKSTTEPRYGTMPSTPGGVPTQQGCTSKTRRRHKKKRQGKDASNDERATTVEGKEKKRAWRERESAMTEGHTFRSHFKDICIPPGNRASEGERARVYSC